MIHSQDGKTKIGSCGSQLLFMVSRYTGRTFVALFIVMVLFVFLPGIQQAQAAAPGGEWWNSSYTLRKKITITATSTAIPTDYTVSFTEDTATLITNSKVRSDSNDWRIAYWNGSTWDELDRWVDDIIGDGWNSANTVTWFKTQAAISASSSDDNYYLYYGYSGETQSPPASMSDSMGVDTASKVFWYADDFEEHAANTDPDGWTDQGAEDFKVVLQGSEKWFQVQTGCGTCWEDGSTASSMANVGDAVWSAKLYFHQTSDQGGDWGGIGVHIGNGNVGYLVIVEDGMWDRADENWGNGTGWQSNGNIHFPLGTKGRIELVTFGNTLDAYWYNPAGYSPEKVTIFTGFTMPAGTGKLDVHVERPWTSPPNDRWVDADDIIVRKYVSPEPTTGLSSEVSGGGGGNNPPTANAGTNQNVSTGATVALDGSGSSDPDSDPLTFTWSFTSKPGGSSATLSDPNIENPTFDADVAGTYELQLIVNDGTVDSAPDTVTITATSLDLAGYSCNMQITVLGSKVQGGPHNYFPVLISLTDDSLKTTGCGIITDSNGYDIIFTNDTKTTQLDHEIEKYDESTGELVAWVKVDLNASPSDTVIYIYYGNSNISSSQENPSGVWSDGYEGVWHLNETVTDEATTGTHYDSTSSVNDGTQSGNDEVTGKIANGQDFDGNDYVESPDSSSLDLTSQVTLSAWVRPTSTGSYDRIVGKSHTSAAAPWTMYGLLFDNANHLRGEISESLTQNGVDGTTVVPLNTWTYATMTYDGSNIRVYFNGSEDATPTALSGSIDTNNVPLSIGRSDYDSDYFNGRIDEVRISSTARSADWIKTSYSNQNVPSSFYNVVKNCPDNTLPPIAEYACSIPITILGSEVQGGPHAKFPVLISLTNNSLKDTGNCGSVQHPDGYDIIFSDSTQTTQLDHEMVSWDGSTGTLEAWVKADLNQSPSDTVINLHFGHSNVCGPTENPTGVWEDNNYAAVWHLDENVVSSPDTFEVRVAADYDDAEEDKTNGVIDRTSSDLELINESEDQEVGMRFLGVTIPPGAWITNAYIEFTVDETDTVATNLTFWGEDADNPLTFSSNANDITDRKKTAASVAWGPIPAWDTTGVTWQSPNIKTIIQEIVDLSGWASGNAMVIIVTGSGTRTAEAYDGVPASAPLLHVEYTTASNYHVDSTSNANHGSANGNTYDASGKIAGAQTFDGTNDWIQAPNSTSLDITGDKITLSAWVKMNAGQSVDAGIINKSYSNDYNYMLGVQDTERANFRVKASSGTTYLTGGTTLNVGQWYFLYGIYDGANAKVYLGNSEDGTDVRTGNIESSGAAPVVLGRRSVYPTFDDRFFNGVIDEARISNVARSTDWMVTEFNNQNDPSSFYSVGSSSCFLGSFSCSRKITIPKEKVKGGSDLSEFPLLIKIDNDCKLRTVANGGRVQNSNGYDIIFTKSDGITQLDHELVSYDAVTGDFVAWVEIPTLSASSDTDIYMYYGSSDMTCDPSNPAGVWDGNYKGVWHLDETSGNHLDSTSYANNATPQNGVNQNATGKIGGADDFDGTDDYVDIGQPANGSLDFDELTDFCISAWFNADSVTSATDYLTLVGQRRQTSIALGIDELDGGTIYFRMDDSTFRNSDNGVVVGDWNHVGLCYDYVSGTTGNVYMYVNGEAQAINGLNAFNDMAPEEWHIGRERRFYDYFDGIIDEVRISGTVRTQGWFQTSYDNQRDPSSFYIMSEDTCGGVYGFQYNYCKKITVDNTQVSPLDSSDLSAFPLLVNITNNDLKSVANGGRVQSDQGWDIVFKTSSCGVLKHEIEKYVPTTGELVAWVQIPTLSASSDTEVYMYYGDSSVECPTENPTAVWDDNYAAVWHLKEDPSGTAPQTLDSTANDNDGTSNGSMTLSDVVDGKIGKGIEVDGTDDWIQAPHSASLDITGDQLTLSSWVKMSAGQTDDVGIILKSTNSYEIHLGIESNEVGNFRVKTPTPAGYTRIDTTTVLQVDQWYYLTGTYDGTTARIYLDGTQENSDSRTGNINATTEPVLLGRRALGDSRWYNGAIDEARISNVARSRDWIRTSYNNQKNLNFSTVGSCFEQTTTMTEAWEEDVQ